MRNARLFEVNIEAEFVHFGGDVFRGSLRLRRSGGTGADVLGQMSELVPGIVAGERRVTDGLQLLEEFLGKCEGSNQSGCGPGLRPGCETQAGKQNENQG